MRDYYYILGCKETVTADEIKAAYRKLSKKFHPDANEGDAFFEERFKEIQEAYEVLGNPTKKSAYDYNRKNNINSTTTKNTHTSSTHSSAGYSSRPGYGHTGGSQSESRTVNKKAHFSFDKYYSQFKKSNRSQKKVLASNAKKLVFFVLLPLAILTCSMNYITKQLNEDVSTEKYDAFVKKYWHKPADEDQQLWAGGTATGESASNTPDRKQTAEWILKKLKTYVAPVTKTNSAYTIKQDGFSFAIDSFYLIVKYSETKLVKGQTMESNKYSFRIPVADIDRVTCGVSGLNIVNKKNTIQQTLLNTNETVVTNQVNIGFKYNAETDLDARMVKAMTHLKQFYNYPDQKDLF